MAEWGDTMSQDESTRVMDTPPPGFDKTMVVGQGMTPPSGATQMGATVSCPICKTNNSGLETYCSDCGFLLSSAPGAVSTETEPDAGSTIELLEASTGRSFKLKPGDNFVGRENCDILLMDGTVSRRHALLAVSGETVTLTDFGSTNGTQLDGVRMSPNLPTVVSAGSTIRFGSASLTLSQGGVLPIVPATAPAEVTVQVGTVPELTFEPTLLGTPSLEVALSAGEATMAAPSEPAPVVEDIDASTIVAVLTPITEVEEIRLQAGTLTLGRRAGNSVIISHDPFVSGSHAQLHCEAGAVSITDVGSTNGSSVNGVRLHANVAQALADGDDVTFGKSEYKFHYFQLGEPAPAAVPADGSQPLISFEPVVEPLVHDGGAHV